MSRLIALPLNDRFTRENVTVLPEAILALQTEDVTLSNE